MPAHHEDEEDELQLLSLDLDALEKDYKAAKMEIGSLKALLAVETQTRQVAQVKCASLEQDKARLIKFQEDCLTQTARQLDYKMKHDSLWQEVRLRSEQEGSKLQEHERAVAALQEQFRSVKEQLDDRIRDLENQLSTKQASVLRLEQETAQLHESMVIASQSFSELQERDRAQCKLEVDKIKSELLVVEETNQMLRDQLQTREKSWMLEKSKLEGQLQELSSNWHVGVLKQKLMKLRKENEDLKRAQAAR